MRWQIIPNNTRQTPRRSTKLSTTAETATATPDNGEGTATGQPSEENATSETPAATAEAGEADDSNVTDETDDDANRLKFYQRKARESEQELKKLRKADEDRQRSEMTEVDRLKAEAVDRDAELSNLKRSQLLTRISAEHGLTPELAERLQGDTEEELTADAKQLAELVGKRPPAASAGAAGIGVQGADSLPTDPIALSRRFMAGR